MNDNKKKAKNMLYLKLYMVNEFVVWWMLYG